MTALLNDDFYEHLHKLEAKGTTTTSWVDIVDNNDKDLLFCQNYTQKLFKFKNYSEEQKADFAKKVRECLDSGVTDVKGIANRLKLYRTETARLLKEYGLDEEREYAHRLWRGVICHNLTTKELWFVRDTKTLAEHINASGPQVVRNAINRGHLLKNHRIYRASQWKQVYPAFNVKKEELLNNDVIRIA